MSFTSFPSSYHHYSPHSHSSYFPFVFPILFPFSFFFLLSILFASSTISGSYSLHEWNNMSFVAFIMACTSQGFSYSVTIVLLKSDITWYYITDDKLCIIRTCQSHHQSSGPAHQRPSGLLIWMLSPSSTRGDGSHSFLDVPNTINLNRVALSIEMFFCHLTN